MTNSALLNSIGGALQTVAGLEGGSVTIAQDLKAMWDVAAQNDQALRIILAYNGEIPRGEFSVAAVMGRVDASFIVLVTRGQGMTAVRGLGLSEQVGNARPFMDLLDDVRDAIRSLQLDIETTERPVDYRGMQPVSVNEQLLNAYQIEFSVGNQLPINFDTVDELPVATGPVPTPPPAPPVPQVTPTFYWTFEEASGSAVDKVHSLPLNVVSVDIPRSAGLIGNGLHLMATPPSCELFAGNVTDPAITSVAGGWSLALWFRVNSWITPGDFFDSDPGFYIRSDNTNFVAWLEFNTTTSKILLHAENDADTFVPAQFTPVLDTWYFCHFFFDPVAQRVGYTIDLGAPVYASQTNIVYGGGLSDSTPYSFNISQVGDPTTSADFQLDEALVQLDRMLTPTELTYLFNSNSGRTWPLT